MRNKISLVFLALCILFGIGAMFCFNTNKPKESASILKEHVPTVSTNKLKENVPTVGTNKLKENVPTVGTGNKPREGWSAPQTGKKNRQIEFSVALFFTTLSFVCICACIRYKLNRACRIML